MWGLRGDQLVRASQVLPGFSTEVQSPWVLGREVGVRRPSQNNAAKSPPPTCLDEHQRLLTALIQFAHHAPQQKPLPPMETYNSEE